MNLESLYLKPIDKQVASKLIIKNHYSHAWTSCRYALGVFCKGNNHQFYGDGMTDDELIGVVVYGFPVGRHVATNISSLITKDNVLELTRLWIKDNTPKNTESYVISLSFDWLRKNDKDIKVLVSYADPSAGHLGKIYQATNWLFQVTTCNEDVLYSMDGGNTWMHPRTVVAKYGSRDPDKLPKPYHIKNNPPKYRYVYILTDKREKKKIVSSLNHETLAYPKQITYVETIKEIQ